MRKFSFKRLSKKQKIIGGLALVVIGVGAFFALRGEATKLVENKPPEPVYGQLTGMEVDEDVAKRPVLGVMIENHPDSRPQTGLDSASIVFESVTEGGITRYLTLFQENMPKDFGPIRSVRPYFVDWMMGFDASIAHVGGSSEALARLNSRNAKTLSQFKYPDAYRRTNTREAPHNMYASSKDLRDLQEKLNHKTSVFTPFPRSSDAAMQTPTAPKITLNFSYGDYAAQFRYQNTDNSYIRFLTGKPDIDAATNKQINVKNVVVIKMGGNTVQAIGTGEAFLFKDGGVQPVRWRQTSYKERIKLTDANGNEVPLSRGDTWFAVLPMTGTVTY